MLPKGTRDILPADALRRRHIQSVMEKVFRQFAFRPIETPAIELNKTLSGKYGEEGDRLMFKVLPRGRKLSKLAGKTEEDIRSQIEEALRYDLTVPLARFVVDNRNELSFPFKRYQIQNVWRADRPQKGRYREFTQCDADVVGVAGIVQEAEFLHIYDQVFRELGLSVKIEINHRALLQSLAQACGAFDRFTDFTVSLDKLDKIGWDGVEKEWNEKGIKVKAMHKELLEKPLQLNEDDLQKLEAILPEGNFAQSALMDLRGLARLLSSSPLKSATLELNLSLARGLDYYTGCIIEVKAEGVDLGSIGGGGRYDELTALFGLKDMPGMGISFGLDRIQLAMEMAGLFQEDGGASAVVILANMGEDDLPYGFEIVQELRSLGIAVEIYPAKARFKKQIDFAVRNGMRYMLIAGEDERNSSKIVIKDLNTGEQQVHDRKYLGKRIQELLDAE